MPILEIDLNCMCLFVPDPAAATSNTGTMHVLMPATHHDRPQHEQVDLPVEAQHDAAHDEHVVMMYYTNARGNPAFHRVRQWSLRVGDSGAPTAWLGLPDGSSCGRVVDLSVITAGGGVERALVDDRHRTDLAARLSLHGGAFWSYETQSPDWVLKGQRVSMAHKVTWKVEVEVAQFQWDALAPRPSGPKPPSLADMKPSVVGEEQVYRIEVYHVTKRALPDNGGPPTTTQLNADEIKQHFRMFYKLLRVTPTDDQLPNLPMEERQWLQLHHPTRAEGWACKTAQAQLKAAMSANS